MITESIKCASCGAVLEQTRSFRIAICVQCNEPNMLCLDDSLSCFSVERQIDGHEVRRIAARAWQEEKTVVTRFPEQIKKDSSVQLYYVPVYVNEGLATVRYIFKKFRTQPKTTVNLQGRIARVPGEAKIQKHTVKVDTKIAITSFHNRGRAIKSLQWGIEHIDLNPDIPVIAVDSVQMNRDGIVLTPNISWESFETQHKRIGARDVELEREVIFQEPKLVYFPVWRLTTRWHQQVFDTFVCGVSGTFLRGSAPQSIKTRATAFSISFTITAAMTSACLLLLFKLFNLFQDDLNYLADAVNATTMMLSIPLMLLGAIMAAIAAFGWDKLRYTPEIVKTAVSSTVVSIDKVNDTWMDKLWKSTLDRVSSQLDELIQ